MGLLDDAIRDHLELKRRSGADPGEVAHQERAALDPVFPAEQPPAGEAVDADDVAAGGHGDGWDATGEADEQPFEESVEPVRQDTLSGGEETAELDMRAVLDSDGGEHGDVATGVGSRAQLAEDDGGAAAPPVRAGGLDDDSFDWEMPGERSEAPIEPSPGQERMSFE